MPELPEVEVTRLGIVRPLTGARIEGVHVGKPLRWALSVAPEALVGRVVQGVRRRGKYLLVDLDRGLLLMHLGMSGSLRFAPELPVRGRHDHFDLLTSQGILRLNDPRRFGAVVYADSESAPLARKLLGRLGMEPLEGFDEVAFIDGLRKRVAPIKQILLAGDLVVGVGNIYASEALFSAGIRPTVAGFKLSRPRALKLFASVQNVLRRALESGGSTLRNFSDAQGQSGHFQLEVFVYGRTGEPCRVCASMIRQIRQGQRSTFFCPKCQKY